MKKSFFTLLSLLWLCLPVFSQAVDVEWGPEQKEIKDTHVSGLIGKDAKGYYVLRVTKPRLFSSMQYYIERYNLDNVVEFGKELKLENKQKKDCTFESIHFLKDRLVLFMSYYNGKEDKNILYAQELDKEGQPMNDPEEVDNVFSKNKRNSGDFNVVVSDDRSKLLIYRNEPYEKNKKEKFSYKVFDNSMKSIWQKDVELQEKDKEVTIKDYKIDNDGNVYAMSAVGKDVSSGLFSKVTLYTYKLITYDYKKDKLDEIPLALAGAKFITQVTFALDEVRNKIIITGFYGVKEKKGIAGTIFTRIDKKSFKAEYETTSPFDKQFFLDVYKNVLSEKKANKKEDVSTNYTLDHLIIKEDGSIMLVAEEYFVEVYTTYSSNGRSSTTYYYNYRNIIAINMNTDGTIKWASVIPKLQKTRNDGGPYSSYSLAYHNDKLYIWYNDNPKNTSPKIKLDKKGTYEMNNPKKALVVMSTINQKGEVTQDAFFKSKNETQTILKPKIYHMFTPNEMWVYAEFKGKCKFGYFKIKN